MNEEVCRTRPPVVGAASQLPSLVREPMSKLIGSLTPLGRPCLLPPGTLVPSSADICRLFLAIARRRHPSSPAGTKKAALSDSGGLINIRESLYWIISIAPCRTRPPVVGAASQLPSLVWEPMSELIGSAHSALVVHASFLRAAGTVFHRLPVGFSSLSLGDGTLRVLQGRKKAALYDSGGLINIRESLYWIISIAPCRTRPPVVGAASQLPSLVREPMSELIGSAHSAWSSMPPSFGPLVPSSADFLSAFPRYRSATATLRVLQERKRPPCRIQAALLTFGNHCIGLYQSRPAGLALRSSALLRSSLHSFGNQ